MQAVTKGRRTRMTRKGLLLSVTITMIAALCACAPAAEVPVGPIPEGATEVSIPDPNLEEVLRTTLWKPEGAIYDTDLKRVSALRGTESGITDLTGLEYCTKLENIWLDGNELTDLSPLAHLTNLQTIDLTGNMVSDVTPLASLSALLHLRLGGNEVSDLSPLSSLTNLTSLYLDRNQVSDISPLASLTNMRLLWLQVNQIEDISALAGLQGLNELRLNANNVSDISVLVEISGFDNKGYITLRENPLSETSLEVYIPQLKEIATYLSY